LGAVVFLVAIFLLIPIFIVTLSQVFFEKEFFCKMLNFFYFLTNFVVFMLVYFVYSNKFGFIVEMLIPLIVLNMVLILLMVKNKVNNRM